MKKVLSIVLSIAMVLCMMPAMAFAGTATASQAAAAYSDTAGTPCEGAVNVLSALGVVDGYTDGTYKPEQVVTRAEMAKLIITALGVDKYATATSSQFTDMGAATWAIPYVEYASNLNIIKGYGHGLFGPNDTVTYEQAATMIVRALGYTDECNEMNGSWPAIYIQKATALGLFTDVVNGGSAGADRGDVALMLYNALEQYEVYADNEGATCFKVGNVTAVINGVTTSRATMLSTLLGKKGDADYKVITDTDVDNALINIRSYLGAAGKLTTKDGDAIAVGDLKSEFITGDLTTDGKLDVDGVKYTINDDAGATISANGDIETTSKAIAVAKLIENGVVSTSAISVDTIKTTYASAEKTVTFAAEISGSTIKKIFSVQTWDSSYTEKVDDGDLAQITANKKLLNVKFAKDDNGAIDTESYALNGVDTLDDIKEDNVVAVYKKGLTKDEIVRIDVGTEVVKGTIEKVSGPNSDQITIDGTKYKKCAASTDTDSFAPGDVVTLYLDYDGKWFDVVVDEATSGDFALVVSAGSAVPSSNATTSDTKIQLYTPSELAVFNVNGKKYEDNQLNHKFSSWSNVTAAAATSSPVTAGAVKIVRYAITDSKVSKIQTIADAAYTDSSLSPASIVSAAATSATAKITKTGYLSVSGGNTYKLANKVVIWSAPTTASGINWDFSDTDKLSLVAREDALDTDIKAFQAVINDKKEVVALLIDDGAAGDKDVYGVALANFSVNDNGSSAAGVDFYIGDTKYTSELLDNGAPTIMSDASATNRLYKIRKTTAGKYSFDALSKEVLVTTMSGVTTGGGIFNAAPAQVKSVSGDKITTVSGDIYYLSSDLTIYTYDKSDDETTVGNYSNRTSLQSEDVYGLWLYKCTDDDSDAYNLINYIVVYQK